MTSKSTCCGNKLTDFSVGINFGPKQQPAAKLTPQEPKFNPFEPRLSEPRIPQNNIMIKPIRKNRRNQTSNHTSNHTSNQNSKHASKNSLNEDERHQRKYEKDFKCQEMKSIEAAILYAYKTQKERARSEPRDHQYYRPNKYRSQDYKSSPEYSCPYQAQQNYYQPQPQYNCQTYFIFAT